VRPKTSAPSGRVVLVKHESLGWIEAKFCPEVYAKSIVDHGIDKGGFGWDSPASDDWLYHRHIQAWAELPEGD